MRPDYTPIKLSDILNFRAREYCLGPNRKISEVRANKQEYLEFLRCCKTEFHRDVLIFFARDWSISCDDGPQYSTIFFTWAGTPPKGYLVLNTLPFCHPKKGKTDFYITIEEASLTFYFWRRRRVLPKRGVFGWKINFEEFLKCKQCHIYGLDLTEFVL
ncbi:MAG: hypothetical protein ABGX24_06330 [Aquificota bacterium]|jgi:hypothetical protein